MASFLDSFPFAVFVLSVLSTKFLHLFIHTSSIPVVNFILYLPSFFVPDIVFVSIFRILLRRERSIISITGYAVGLVLSVVTLGAASAQIGFYVETGGEIEWKDAGAFAGDEEGLKVLLDGVNSVGLSMIAILVPAWVLKAYLYRLAGDFVAGLGSYIASVWTFARRRFTAARTPDVEEASRRDSMSNHSESHDSHSDFDTHEGQHFLGSSREKHHDEGMKCHRPRRSTTIMALATLLYLCITALIRPEKPYNHMTTTLPWPLLDAYRPAPNPCEESVLRLQNQWPLLNVTSEKYWKEADGNFKGWTPGRESNASMAYRNHHPDWLPLPAPRGFARWNSEEPSEGEFTLKHGQGKNKEHQADGSSACAITVTDDTFYSPVTDPLRLTNLDTDILSPLQEVFDSDGVKIKHVMFVLMESMREELFPLQQGSDIHKFILDSHMNEEQKQKTNEKLSRLTPNAERLTGKPGNFFDTNSEPYPLVESAWDDNTKPGFGGINVVGGLTPSSVSTKSLAALHCGTWPLPVDKFEEADLQTYQPCLPQIFHLFNTHKNETESSDDFRGQQWSPAFFQATTDHYDRQDEFGEHMGFVRKVTKKELSKKRLGGEIEEINYFGYAETALKPYMEEYINQTLAANKRMFLSHFTSTTHHSWSVPKDFNSTRYMSFRDGAWHKDMNKYLNTVRFVDGWLGEVMQMLDDFGIADETLVVFVGDHGQAFKEDTKKTGTYENGHVSNYRVPITLRHPQLPRIQYEANATSISLLPTVLDLLINTNSLNSQDLAIASDIIHDYEGQSLIRPYKTQEDGRRAWNFGVVNSGGGMLTVTSADAPWRMVVPLSLEVAYVFTDVKNDPLELEPTSTWTFNGLLKDIEARFGAEAVVWAKEAQAVTKWWVVERKRLWGYNKSK